jgi:hypothetical protein
MKRLHSNMGKARNCHNGQKVEKPRLLAADVMRFRMGQPPKYMQFLQRKAGQPHKTALFNHKDSSLAGVVGKGYLYDWWGVKRRCPVGFNRCHADGHVDWVKREDVAFLSYHVTATNGMKGKWGVRNLKGYYWSVNDRGPAATP